MIASTLSGSICRSTVRLSPCMMADKKHKTLLKQMTEYPMGKNDDGPDGLQMAVKLALDIKVGRRVDYRSVIARALDFKRGAY